MPIVMLSGIHGVGKTTAVNKLNINLPLVKFTDVDMIEGDGVGFTQQMQRMRIMIDVVDAIPSNMNVIVDRSPCDFEVYNYEVLKLSGSQMRSARELQDELMRKTRKLKNCTHVLVYDDFDAVMERITLRGRIGLKEEDETFTRNVFNSFYRGGGANMFALTGIEFVTIYVGDLDAYLYSFFHK